MRLVASMIVRDEADRYLDACLDHLLVFCDEIRVLDDGSGDDTPDLLRRDRVHTIRNSESVFFQHEGRARQQLLEWTLQAQPTHVLAVDADEFVTDGPTLRATLEQPEPPASPTPVRGFRQAGPPRQRHSQPRSNWAWGIWTLPMTEIWSATSEALWVRGDGGWRQHPVPMLWQVPDDHAHVRIADRALACGREPFAVNVACRRGLGQPSGAAVLHFGWACRADRQQRYNRYMEADGGKFHASQHLRSIMWADQRVRLTQLDWPDRLRDWQPRILARANRQPA